MPQYGILVYSPAPADPLALTPDHVEALDRYPAQAERHVARWLGSRTDYLKA